MFSPRHWWKLLALVFVVGGTAVTFMGVQTYREAPPIADFVDAEGRTVFTADAVHRGKEVFLKYALMEYGSMFGDGAGRGPDFTAETLHQVAVWMNAWHRDRLVMGADDPNRAATLAGLEDVVRREIKANGYDPATGRVALSAAQADAAGRLPAFLRDKFAGAGPERFKPAGYITDATELADLAAFFFWGAWVTGAERPGAGVSYTHNWPFDPLAGNTLTAASVLWSVVGSLTLILAIGLTMYFYGRVGQPADRGGPDDRESPATAAAVARFVPTPTQRATYKFFAVAVAVFLFQVVGGILTIHDFVGFTTFFGFDLTTILPITVTRSWHVQLSILWIAACWIAGSIFVLPQVARTEPRGQLALVNLLFWLLVVVVAGTVVGGWMGPMGALGDRWQLLGNQGWEFVEMGRLWQVGLFLALILWAVIIVRGLRPAIGQLEPFALPRWLVYAVVTIVLLFISSFVAQPRTNFVVADFWRWMVVHMWAECFFEVFTTVVIAYYMVLMGLVGRAAATRIVFFASVLFLGSGLVGISHNFYWNAKPEATLALGAVFSTMQVVPLLMLTLEAWQFRRLPGVTMRAAGGREPEFGLGEAFLFLLGVNFWNFVGAGVLGFIINLPAVNYFEHGTYLTVNHGHAALMGVYGNLSLAAVLYCARYLVRPERWNGALLRMAFWSLNIGLVLTVVLDLFPAGIAQLRVVLEQGLWAGRSAEFIQGATFQTLTWMRLLGGAVFVVGGVIPLTAFMVSRARSLRAAAPAAPAAPERVEAASLPEPALGPGAA